MLLSLYVKHIPFQTIYLYERNKKFMLNYFIEKLSRYTNIYNTNSYDNVDPNLIRYFRTEYGADWKVALDYHLYQKSLGNNKPNSFYQ